MATCARCGGSYFYDATDEEWRCLSCARPRDAPPPALPYRREQKERPRHLPIGPSPAPPGYRRMDEIAVALGVTLICVFQRIRARGVPYRTGKRRVILIAEADVATLALDAKAWRERSRAS